MDTQVALEVAELSRQFVTDFALKIVCVDTASVSVDVVLSGVVLADYSIALVAHISDDAVRHTWVFLLERLRPELVINRSVKRAVPDPDRGDLCRVRVKSISGRALDRNRVEALGGPSRRSFGCLRDRDAVDLLEQGRALDRVWMVALQERICM